MTDKIMSCFQYHLVFCPRCRRKIFIIPGVKERFEGLVREKCIELDTRILCMDFGTDYVRLHVEASPMYSPSEVVTQIKHTTGKALREEFGQLSKMPNVWTKNYLVSTEYSLNEEKVLDFVSRQKKRY